MTMQFRKGFESSKLHAQFVGGLQARDCWAMKAAVAAQAPERLPVDCAMFAVNSTDRALLRYDQGILPGTPAFAQELELVEDLAVMRDAPLSSLGGQGMAEGYHSLSMFFDPIRVDVVAPKDFITDADTWKRISRDGKRPTEALETNGTTSVVTGRDLATYVHDDNPFTQWGSIIGQAFELGVPARCEEKVDELDGYYEKFACWGPVFLTGVIGDLIRRVGILSFTRKWDQLVPRPEEAAFVMNSTLLPQCYPEGSPMHPSRNAMHSIIALTCAHLLKRVFDPAFAMPSGRTFGEELDLFADNIGYGRVWAGVHYPADHEGCRRTAEALADKVYREIM